MGREGGGLLAWEHEGSPGIPPGHIGTAGLPWQGQVGLVGIGPPWFSLLSSFLPSPNLQVGLGLPSNCAILSYINLSLSQFLICVCIEMPPTGFSARGTGSSGAPSLQSESRPRVRPRLWCQHSPLPSGLRLPEPLIPGPATLTSPIMLQPYRQLLEASSYIQQSKCIYQAKHLSLPKGAGTLWPKRQ